MLRSKHFVNLVNEAVSEGFQKGITTFMENLEEQLQSDEFFESVGGYENYFNNVLAHNIIDEELNFNEGVEEVTEEQIDTLLTNYGHTE